MREDIISCKRFKTYKYLSFSLCAFVLIFFSFNVLAADFTLDSPDSVYLNEEFEVSIDSSLTGKHDVKIFSVDNNNEITSFIYNDGWKNAYYYLKSTFPDEKEYKIKISSSEGEESEQTLCARLRPEGKTSYTEACTQIEVKQGLSDNSNEEEDDNDANDNDEENDETNDADNGNEDDDNDESEDDDHNIVRSVSKSSTNTNTNLQAQPLATESNNIEQPLQGKIILTKQKADDTSSKQEASFSTPKQRTAIWISIAFAVFCVAILILIIFRKI